MPTDIPAGDGRSRVVVEGLRPQIDDGCFPIKRVLGEHVSVEADILADGHDVLSCVVCYRHDSEQQWREVRMAPLGNDRWRASFKVDALGLYRYAVIAWVDRFRSWQHDLKRREDPADISVAILVGADLVTAAAARSTGMASKVLRRYAERLATAETPEEGCRVAFESELEQLMALHGKRHHASRSTQILPVQVDPVRARFSSWYEFFPRSSWNDTSNHGTLKDCEKRLEYVASMGFDVLYLPPIHPIGTTHRKGRNNARSTGPGDPGSPWAIGASEGGHTAIHPALGSLEDLRSLVTRARDVGIDLALDIAFQCSPDHPWVKTSPQWFRHRPDGSVQYAENPPKKYQDIYPFDFETSDWRGLWNALRDVVLYWAGHGVRVFRVDNPHTKPFPFWQWLIQEVKSAYPEAIFLAEAFTRPKVMKRLAKVGFTQSYTYFTWRNTKQELTAYFEELAHGDAREYFRPNLWPNTPDILPEYLQYGGRAGFMARATLAATLGASFGIYGPAFELLDCVAREPGTEEYLDSEKYQLRRWDIERDDSLRDFLSRLNRIRRDNAALQSDWNLAFHPVDNDNLICFSKQAGDNAIVVVANLDPHHAQAGWIELPTERFDLAGGHPFQAHDLLSDARYLWHGSRNFVRLDPTVSPAHVFCLRRRVRTEHDFDYYL